MNLLSELKISQLQSILIGLYNLFNMVSEELVLINAINYKSYIKQ